MENQNANNFNDYAQQNQQMPNPPAARLKTDRGWLKFFLLNLITLNIYSIFFYSGISSDINIAASRYDGKKTMHYCLLYFVVGILTCGIGFFVWFHKISNRIGAELSRRQINYSFGAGDFWLWNILGALIIVGPFIYIHKLSMAMNLLAQDYNNRG